MPEKPAGGSSEEQNMGAEPGHKADGKKGKEKTGEDCIELTAG